MKMEILCTLVREQAASQVTFEHFDGNPLSFAYFLSMSTESVEKKIEEPMGRLPRLNAPLGRYRKNTSSLTNQKRVTEILWNC